MGSPKEVPVPWHSVLSISGGLMPTSLITANEHLSCAGPLGAVNEALRPSWFAWLPASKHKSLSLSKFFSLIPLDAVASPRAYPSAEKLYVKHLPRCECMPAAQQPMYVKGLRLRLTPQVITASHGS